MRRMPTAAGGSGGEGQLPILSGITPTVEGSCSWRYGGNLYVVNASDGRARAETGSAVAGGVIT